jgi:hypothetical protein
MRGYRIAHYDSGFHVPLLLGMGAGQAMPYFPFVVVMSVIPFWAKDHGLEYLDLNILNTLLGVYGVIVLLVVVVILRRLGHKTLNSSNARRWILALVQKVRRGRGRYDDVIVVKCGDDFWRDVVTTALDNAHAVIIDCHRAVGKHCLGTSDRTTSDAPRKHTPGLRCENECSI